MSSFVSLHTGLSGIRAGQAGLDTASHNVANANTRGFTRQRVDLASANPYWSPVGPMGTGVDVVGITRTRDMFLDARVRTVSAEAEWHATGNQLLRRAEMVLAEPDNGISAQAGEVWDAFEDLSLDPDDGAARQQVVSALGSMSSRVRAVTVGWDQLAKDTQGRLDVSVREVNDLIDQVAELNREIGEVRLRKGIPNDLYDQRDLALDELASRLGATIAPQADGSVTVSLPRADGPGSVTLVEGSSATKLNLDGDTISASTDEGDVAVAGRGEVFALQTFLTTTLPGVQEGLDAFVTDFAEALNTRHGEGYDSYGEPGGDLLTFDPDLGPARSLQVGAGVAADPRRLAAAAEEPVATHDGRNADRLAALRSEKVGESTLDDRLKEQIVGLAAAVATSGRQAEAQLSLTVSATSARQGMHGVSLDEEMVAVVQYQRSLEAVSRVMTAIDQALDTLINRTGLVGR